MGDGAFDSDDDDHSGSPLSPAGEMYARQAAMAAAGAGAGVGGAAGSRAGVGAGGAAWGRAAGDGAGGGAAGGVQLGGLLGGVLRGVLRGVLELELEVELGVQLEVQQPEVQDQLGTLTTTGRARYWGHAGRRTRAGSVPLKKLSKGAAAAAAAAGRLAPPLPESQCVSRTVSVASQWISIWRLGLERSSPTGSWTLR